VQPTKGYFLPVIITLFSTLAFVAILVVIFGVIVRRRKESSKREGPKNEKHENEHNFDDGLRNYDIIYENEENSYEIMNYEFDGYHIGVYDQINENESKIEANTSKAVEYLEMSEKN
jgi:hypothetical protein